MKTFLGLPSPLWILGTDTGVGKTFVARSLSRHWAAAGPVVYRKPFQTGVSDPEHAEADQGVVAGAGIAVETGLCLKAPLAPLAAAEAEGRAVDLDALRTWCLRPVPDGAKLILEGVGGVLVPLAEHRHFAAWAADLQLPALLVARGGLGTLNHTLLSAEALMLRGWTIAAVLLNPGLDGSHAAAEGNADILRRFLPVPVRILD